MSNEKNSKRDCEKLLGISIARVEGAVDHKRRSLANTELLIAKHTRVSSLRFLASKLLSLDDDDMFMWGMWQQKRGCSTQC